MPTLCSLNLFNWSDFIPNFTICSQLGRRILLFVSESIWAEFGVAGMGDRTSAAHIYRLCHNQLHIK